MSQILTLATALALNATGIDDPIRLNVTPFAGGMGREALLHIDTAPGGASVVQGTTTHPALLTAANAYTLTDTPKIPELEGGPAAAGWLKPTFWNKVQVDALLPDSGRMRACVLRQPPAALKIDGPDGRPVYEVNPNAENLRNLGAREEGDPDDFPAEQRGMRYYRNQIQSLVMKLVVGIDGRWHLVKADGTGGGPELDDDHLAT